MLTIGIIGGGAAGMMAAVTISEMNPAIQIILIERNDDLGRKVKISGGGRCNLTTGVDDLKEVLKKYPRGSRFLRHAFYEFPPQKMMEWVEDQGVALKMEDDLRVFPISNKGSDLVDVFEQKMRRGKVKIWFKTTAERIEKENDQFIIYTNHGKPLIVDKLILTTGGQAYQGTGSLGDGYGFAQKLGHTITALAPSLSAYLLEEKWAKSIPGVSFKSVRLRLQGDDKHEFTGPVMFTHKGITGPAVFALSSLAAFEELTDAHTVTLMIDFLPNISWEELTNQLNQISSNSPQQKVINSLGGLVPKSLAKAVSEALKIDLNKKNAELSKKDLNKFIEALKNSQCTVNGRTAGEEFVTAGGVELDEINPKTMESKKCDGLFFAGEILNCDGFTGGYNLHIAWATGRLAGNQIK